MDSAPEEPRCAGWASWWGSWLTATLLGTWLFATLYSAMLGARGIEFLFPAVVLPFLAVGFVLPMTVAAAGLRWLWLHLSPSPWRAATLPAIAIGAASGPLGLLLLDLHTLVVLPWDAAALPRALGDWPGRGSVLLPPLLLGGAAAGYLAHRLLWPTRARWWAIVTVACVAGLVLMSPQDLDVPFGR